MRVYYQVELVDVNMKHTFKLHVKTKIVAQGITLGECNVGLASFENSFHQYVLLKKYQIFRVMM